MGVWNLRWSLGRSLFVPQEGREGIGDLLGRVQRSAKRKPHNTGSEWSVHVCRWCGLFMCAAGVACSCVQLAWPVHACSWCSLFMCAAGVACSCVQLVWPVHVCTKYVASEISSCVKVGGRPGFLAVRTVSVEVKPH